MTTRREIYNAGKDHMEGCPENNWRYAVDEYIEGSDSPDPSWEDAKDEIFEKVRDHSYDAEQNSRQFSPWEFTAKELNGLQDTKPYDVWEVYDEGISAYMNQWLRSKENQDMIKAYYLEQIEE